MRHDYWRDAGVRKHLTLLMILALNGACAGRIEPEKLNSQLTYINRAKAVVRIDAGLRLRVTHYLADKRKLTLTPTVGAYEWVRPDSGHYSRNDYLFGSYLLVTARRSEEFDELKEAAAVAATIPSDFMFNDAFGSKVLEPMFAGLELQFSATAGIAESDAARYYQELLCRGGKHELMRDDSQTLRAVSPFDKTVTLTWNLSDWFFERPPESFSVNDKNYPWFNPTSDRRPGRAMIDVEVPVVLEGQGEVRYVPICWTLEQLEVALGREIAAVQRRAEYVSEKPTQVGWRTLTFGRTATWSFRPAARLDRMGKALVLVAAGDRIVLSQRPSARTSP